MTNAQKPFLDESGTGRVWSPSPAFTHVGHREHEEELSAALSSEAAERERSERELARVTRALRTLSWSNQSLVRATDEGQLLSDVCDVAVNIGGYRMAWVGFLAHDASRAITPVAVAGAEDGYLSEIQVDWSDGPRGRGPAGRCIRERAPIVSRDIAADDAIHSREAAIEHGFRSVISLPLPDRGGSPIGLLCIYAAEPEAFDEEEMALLVELSLDLAYGIESLRERVRRRKSEASLRMTVGKLERLVADVVQAMGHIVEVRDPYTQGHEERVSRLAVMLAGELGLADDIQDAVRTAGLLHDIGKLFVPTEILSKPGQLSVPEFDLIKEHSQRGYDILKGIEFPWPIADIVLQHHERVDGSGYPAGLSGDDIRLEARILAVADVVEAMASDRPYRPALGLEEAMEEIRRRAAAYDPAVTAACERLHAADLIAL